MTQEKNDDDVYAPLVDGLSGATCVLLLVLVSFMLVSSSLVRGSVHEFKVNDSEYQEGMNRVNFFGIVKLSKQDVENIRESIGQLNNPQVYVYVPKSVKNSEYRMAYNLKQFSLSIGQNIKTHRGDSAECESIIQSCIYWKEEG